MEVDQIQNFVKAAIADVGEHENLQCMNGTVYTITLLGEIAQRLANIDNHLSQLQFRAPYNALVVEVQQ